MLFSLSEEFFQITVNDKKGGKQKLLAAGLINVDVNRCSPVCKDMQSQHAIIMREERFLAGEMASRCSAGGKTPSCGAVAKLTVQKHEVCHDICNLGWEKEEG